MGLKRLVKKVTSPIGKAVKKIVPKELAGIMQVAAPLAGPYAPLVYAAGAYKQSGRINPIALATMALPYVGTTGGISGLKYGNLSKYGTLGQDVFTARDLLGLRNAQGLRGSAERFLFGTQDTRGLGDFASEEGFVPKYSDQTSTGLASQGFLGSGGEFDLKSSKLLSSTDTKGNIKLSPTKITTAVTMGLSLSQTQEQIAEEGGELGLADEEIARLQAEAADMWKDFDTTAFKPKVAQGGLMRINYAKGSDDDELKPDPTAPVNPFKPKPIGPVLPDRMAQVVDMDILKQMFLEALDKGEIPPGTDFDTYKDMMMMLMSKRNANKGGLMRTNFALGTKPTKQESGLGGLPIEADMRYSGGFMPYGKKEKADDVPARLSKNEFVFTADAVRAAGGGNINMGARRMYNTMKQLESMGRA